MVFQKDNLAMKLHTESKFSSQLAFACDFLLAEEAFLSFLSRLRSPNNPLIAHN
jgi:hypothetical protein